MRCGRRSIATAIAFPATPASGLRSRRAMARDLLGLLKSADLAMYAAKAAGRRTYRFFEPTHGEAGQPAPRARERSADGAGRGRVRTPLPAAGRSAQRRRHRLRGAAALAASAARHGFAGRFHSGGRGYRPDRGDRAVGVADRLRGSGHLARPCAHRRQRLAGPVPLADTVAEGRGRARRDRARSAPAGARDHRSRADRGRRRGAGGAQPIARARAFTSRSTISAPAIPRCNICSGSRSTRSRSTAASSRKSPAIPARPPSSRRW